MKYLLINLASLISWKKKFLKKNILKNTRTVFYVSPYTNNGGANSNLVKIKKTWTEQIYLIYSISRKIPWKSIWIIGTLDRDFEGRLIILLSRNFCSSTELCELFKLEELVSFSGIGSNFCSFLPPYTGPRRSNYRKKPLKKRA